MLLPANAKVNGIIPLYVELKALKKSRNYILVRILKS